MFIATIDFSEKILHKCDTFCDSLTALGSAYPFSEKNETTFDNIAGAGIIELRKKLNKFAKILSSELEAKTTDKKAVNTVFEEFKFHKAYLGKLSGTNDNMLYYPFSIMLDDGQILVGLAREYGYENEVTKDGVGNNTFRIVKWILNEEDITSAVYGKMSEAREIMQDANYAKLAKKIATIIFKNHTKFVKKNGGGALKEAKELRDLEEKKEELVKKRDELKSLIESKKTEEDEQAKKDKSVEDEDDKQEKVKEDIETNPEDTQETTERDLKSLLNIKDIEEVDKKLDEIVSKMSDDDLEKYDELLNEVADYITKLDAEEE